MIPPTPKNYRRFVEAVITVDNIYIPRRNTYLAEQSRVSSFFFFYDEFMKSGDTEIADELI